MPSGADGGCVARGGVMDEYGEILFEMAAEMKRGFFDVPLPDDITMDDLKDETGAKPVIASLPFMAKNVRSENGWNYTASIAESIVRQARENRPEGHFGHTKPENISTEYKAPDMRCLNAAFDEDGTAWGLFHAISPDACKHLTTAKKHKAKVGLSIWGRPVLSGGKLADVVLQKIDLADPARVGIKRAAAIPHLTAAEMQQGEDMEQIAELTGQRDQLQEQVTTLTARVAELEPSAALVSELRDIFGDKDIVAEIRQMAANELTARKEALATGITALIAEMVELEPMRDYVAEKVQGAESLDEARSQIAGVMESATYAKFAKAVVAEMKGPAAIVPPKQDEADDRESFLERVIAKGTEKAKARGLA